MSDDITEVTCDMCGQMVKLDAANLYGDQVTIDIESVTGEDIGRAFDVQKQQYNDTVTALKEKGVTLRNPWWEIFPVQDTMFKRKWVSRWRAKGGEG